MKAICVYVCAIQKSVRVEIANVKCGASRTSLSRSSSGHFVFLRCYSKCFLGFLGFSPEYKPVIRLVIPARDQKSLTNVRLTTRHISPELFHMLGF